MNLLLLASSFLSGVDQAFLQKQIEEKRAREEEERRRDAAFGQTVHFDLPHFLFFAANEAFRAEHLAQQFATMQEEARRRQLEEINE